MKPAKQYPLHFWQIHKKIYNREFAELEHGTRSAILIDRESEQAEAFFAFVHRQTVKYFEDADFSYNSNWRFKYNPHYA